MKKLLAMLAILAMTGFTSAAYGGEFVGWLADEKCANGGKAASEGHANCAQNCVNAGQPIAFVNDADKKVYKVANQDAVKDHVGKKVTLMGNVEGDSITVESVKGD